MYSPPNPRLKGLKALRNEAQKRHADAAKADEAAKAVARRAAMRAVAGK